MGKIAIEEVTIKGFKSFGRRTKIKFSSAITAIVGPNGSGKSNIIDAIEFALGSIKFSELRVKNAQDLLFKGKTKRAKEAEVEIKIRASSPYTQEGYLIIKRKLRADGTSYYYLNGKRSTRIRILDALSSINVDVESLNVISQGEVARFIKLSPRERKKYLEKLAGVDLYELKKKMAMEDLEKVNLKLSKVSFVYKEKMKFLERLEEDLHKLELFRSYSEMKRRAEFSILLEKREKIISKINQLREDIKKSEEELKDLKNIEKLVKEARKRLAIKLDSINSKLLPLERKISELEFRYKIFREKLEKMRAELKEAEKSLSSALEEKERLKILKEKLKEDIRELEAEIQKLQNLRKELEEKDLILGKKYSKLLEEYNRKLVEYERVLEERKSLEKKISEKSKAISEIDGQLKQLERTIKVLSEELEEEKKRIEAELKKRREMESELDKLEKEKKKVENEVKKIKEKIKSILPDFPPSTVEILRSRGYKTLYDIYGGKKLVPLSHIFVELSEEPEEGWAVSVSKEMAEELKKLADNFEILGTIDESQVLARGEKLQILSDLKRKEKSLESKLDTLRKRIDKIRLELSIPLRNRTPELEKSLSALEKERKKLIKSKNVLVKELEGLRLPPLPKRPEMPKLPEFEDVKRRLQEVLKKVEDVRVQISQKRIELERLEAKFPILEEKEKNLRERIAEIKKEIPEMEEKLKLSSKHIEELSKEKTSIENIYLRLKRAAKALEEFLSRNSAKISRLERNLEKSTLLLSMSLKDLERLEASIEKFQDVEPVENPEEVLREVEKKIQELGPLNYRAKEEYEKIKQEVGEIAEKLKKLEEEKRSVMNLIEETENMKNEKFGEFIQEVTKNFEKLTVELLGFPFTIHVQDDFAYIIPRDSRKAFSVGLLSGGQKVLLSLAFLMAVHRTKPTTFFIFDEVDAPLDKMNTQKLVKFLRKLSETAQIILVTHNDITIAEADEIIGVYMEDGVTKVIGLPKEKLLKEREKWIEEA